MKKKSYGGTLIFVCDCENRIRITRPVKEVYCDECDKKIKLANNTIQELKTWNFMQ